MTPDTHSKRIFKRFYIAEKFLARVLIFVERVKLGEVFEEFFHGFKHFLHKGALLLSILSKILNLCKLRKGHL